MTRKIRFLTWKDRGLLTDIFEVDNSKSTRDIEIMLLHWLCGVHGASWKSLEEE